MPKAPLAYQGQNMVQPQEIPSIFYRSFPSIEFRIDLVHMRAVSVWILMSDSEVKHHARAGAFYINFGIHFGLGFQCENSDHS